ncbi:hypothetical protein N7450_002420 [Penicillium hetheringtonii]|uniref:Uncharacterized protein n=1 Tax=Penicillium hetheringtonii TaxID=911720 RepID=A0AAD6GY47_9EURO|nr:hypothetical protein N7450_002420 [Penicillium hetheringtonii]
MSRNFLPVALAIGVGVFTGYYTFQPTFQQLAIEKVHGNGPAGPQSNAGAPSSINGPSADVNSQSSKPTPGAAGSDKDQ